jgi:predicted DCC family thiol-disulfide oxidoreductase YuxK
MNRLTSFLESIWFPALPPGRLALIRILTGLYTLWYLVPRYSMLRSMETIDADLFQPVGIAAWLTAPLPAGWLQALIVATLLLNVAYIAGWKYRYTGPAFGLSLLALLCYRNSWSMIYHSDNALVAHVLIIGCTRAADLLSFDAWRTNGSAPEAHWRYGWPVQLISTVTVLTYFLAGIAKLLQGRGLAWAAGESMRSQIAVDTIRKEILGAPSSALAYDLYDQVWLFTILGVFSLVLEVLAPLALLRPRIGQAWAVNAFGMHWGIYLLMHITFRYQMTGLLFLSFFPLERLVAYFRRPLAGAEPGTDVVVFDGMCRFCRAQMRLLQRVDITGRLGFLSLHERQARHLLPELSHADLMKEMVVVDTAGRRHRGAAAVRYLFRRLPLLWPGAPLLHLPGSMPLWTCLYEAIARRRYRIAGTTCQEGTCDLRGYGNV